MKNSSIMAKLTAKQQRFVSEYLIDLNATQAAIRAGYSERTARSVANENLTKPNIQREIEKLQQETRERNDITRDEVIGVLASIIRSDVPDYFEAGRLKDFNKLTPAQRKAIESIKTNKQGVTEFKLPSKIQAVATINRMLGYDSAINIEAKGTINILDLGLGSPPKEND